MFIESAVRDGLKSHVFITGLFGVIIVEKRGRTRITWHYCLIHGIPYLQLSADLRRLKHAMYLKFVSQFAPDVVQMWYFI